MRNSGFLAAIPELTQCEVNNLVRAIHVSELMPDVAAKEKLKSLFALFQFRGSDTLKMLYGVDISNPYLLTEELSNCPEEMYERRAEVLSPLRLVATKEAFRPGQLDYYAVNNSSLFRPENWPPLTRQLLT